MLHVTTSDSAAECAVPMARAVGAWHVLLAPRSPASFHDALRYSASVSKPSPTAPPEIIGKVNVDEDGYNVMPTCVFTQARRTRWSAISSTATGGASRRASSSTCSSALPRRSKAGCVAFGAVFSTLTNHTAPAESDHYDISHTNRFTVCGRGISSCGEHDCLFSCVSHAL